MCSSCLPCTANNCAQVLCVFETRDTLVVEMFDPAVATAAIAADSRLAQGGSIASSVDTEGGDFAELQCPTVAINEMYRRTNPEVSYSRPGDECYGRFTPPGSRLLALASSRPPQLLVGGRRFIDLRRVIASAVAVLRRGGGFGPPELLLPGVDAVVKRIRQRTAATTIQVGDDVLHRVKKC